MTSVVVPSSKEMSEIREVQAVTRSTRVRGMANILPDSGLRMRKAFFTDKVGGEGWGVGRGWCVGEGGERGKQGRVLM
jgi:hypothetical protein